MHVHRTHSNHGFLKTPPKKDGIKNSLKNPKKDGIKNILKNPKKDGIKNSLKNPIWKKELKNPISNPRFQKLKSKEGFDLLPAMVEHKSMQDQNLGSIPTIKTQEHARSKPKSMHESKPIVGSATAEQRRSNNVFLPRLGFATIISSEAHCRSE